MCREAHQIDFQLRKIDFNFTRSLCSINVEENLFARVISPIAATSVVVPISLFTIRETRMVSGRIAASTISGVIKPVLVAAQDK